MIASRLRTLEAYNLLRVIQDVGTEPTVLHSTRENLQWASRNLEMQLLPSHYHNGQLVLKCTAEILELYAESTDALLWSTRKEPIPERVTSPNRGLPNQPAPASAILLIAYLSIRYFRR
ncbi:unnamed protein product [Hermetia illucens]|uniref:Uncharacterized protein n=1 Tax=Hermetia illucens TaxID=343691 RepID=A0A7R8UMV6_HERIL|nr:unnamed protein product [Hermetia illucens]